MERRWCRLGHYYGSARFSGLLDRCLVLPRSQESGKNSARRQVICGLDGDRVCFSPSSTPNQTDAQTTGEQCSPTPGTDGDPSPSLLLTSISCLDSYTGLPSSAQPTGPSIRAPKPASGSRPARTWKGGPFATTEASSWGRSPGRGWLSSQAPAGDVVGVTPRFWGSPRDGNLAMPQGGEAPGELGTAGEPGMECVGAT